MYGHSGMTDQNIPHTFTAAAATTEHNYITPPKTVKTVAAAKILHFLIHTGPFHSQTYLF